MLTTNPLVATLLVASPDTIHLRRNLEPFLIFVYCLPLGIFTVWAVVMLYIPVFYSLISTVKLSQTYDIFSYVGKLWFLLPLFDNLFLFVFYLIFW